MVSALILLAEGTEESEFTITYDVLVRGGVHVDSALVPPASTRDYVVGSRGVKLVADRALPDPTEVLEYNALIIPGGAKGAETMSSSKHVQHLIRTMHQNRRLVAAICAGPLALLAANIAPHSKITSHPSVQSQLDKHYEYIDDERVVVADKLITSRGPGTSFEFALAIVEALVGAGERATITPPLCLGPIV